MSKKRIKLSEIAEEMFEIIRRKPTKEQLEELAEVLNEENPDVESDSFQEEMDGPVNVVVQDSET